MRKMKKFELFYLFVAVMVLAVSTIGATYAYWTASTSSTNNAVQTKSTIYSISMEITPLYHGFSIIPMNDSDALKALKKECKDKYGRGACSAYTIYVYDYSADLNYVSGVMDVTSHNMQNLSYMMFRLSDVYDEEKCLMIGEESYCIAKEAASMGDGVGLSLGDAYDVTGMESTKFILLIWLSNLSQSQNDVDVGSFEAVVTMQAGNGGEIKGSISSVIVINPDIETDESTDNTDNPNNTEESTDTTTDNQNQIENGA